jgi:AmiR/NasT family two-component response regulator
VLERHGVAEAAAFEMLRGQSRESNRRVIDLATAVVDGHVLLSREPRAVPG